MIRVKGINKCYDITVKKYGKDHFCFTCGNFMTGMTSVGVSKDNAKQIRDWLSKEIKKEDEGKKK